MTSIGFHSELSQTMESDICLNLTTEEQHQSNYHKMLNNIASDLDLLLNDLCHIYPHPDQANTSRFQTLGKGQYSDSSPGFGEDSAFGTLASTDSYACEQKHRSDSLQSGHLDVFGLEDKGLQIPSYTELGSDPVSEPRSINFEERLSKTHSIWYLPKIGRSGAVHLLKDREPGTFIIRESSQSNTLALSAQFPENGQPNVDHYLIQHSDKGYRVQGSLHDFKALPDLIVYYHENIEELPCRLVLPPTIRRAKTLQELTSLSYLGQDFWTSYRFDRGMVGYNYTSRNLHKSTSEPVNITQASHFSNTSLPVAKIMPSKSMQQFRNTSGSPLTSSSVSTLEKSSPSLGSVPESLDENGENVMFGTGNDYKETGEEVCEKCQARRMANQTRSEESLHSSANSSERAKSIERSLPNTHPRTPSKTNSNLYFTTSIELLNNSENQYFHSNLSDKMSDYEDIWKHSAAATPVPSVKLYDQRTPVSFSNTASVDHFNHEGCMAEPVYSKPDKSTMNNKGLKKEAGNDLSKGFEIVHNNLSNPCFTSPNTLSCSQGNMVYENERSSSKNNLHRTLSLDDYKIKNAKRSDFLSTELLDVKSTVSVQTQTSPKMKSKPEPLPAVDNDSSSTSTALSSVKSPVYAEPFDSLVAEKTKSKKSKLRRRSAPSMGFSARKVKGVSQTPNLETIFSPNFDHSHSVHESSFNFSKQSGVIGASEGLPPNGLRRTQSAKSRSRRECEQVPILNKESLDDVVKKLEKLSSHKDNISTQSTPLHAQEENIIKSKLKPKVRKSSFKSSNVSNAQNDLTWEELSKQEQEVAASTLRKFPVYKREVAVSTSSQSSTDESSTVEDMISSMNPSLTLKPIKLRNPHLQVNQGAMSEYDNLTNQYAPTSHKSHASTGTVFCIPWENSNLFEALMDPKNCKLPPPMDVNERIHAWQEASHSFNKEQNDNRHSIMSESTVVEETDLEDTPTNFDAPSVFIHPPSESDLQHLGDKQSQPVFGLLGSQGQGDRVLSYSSEEEPVPSFPLSLPSKKKPLQSLPAQKGFLQNKLKSTHPDSKIEEYICRLSRDHSTTFGSTIENFIQCTIDSQESNPHHVTRNVRQFMTGIRNYLVKHGEGELEDIIERERTKLKADEILNIDAIIERALHTCVLRPLKHHIYNLFVDEYTKNGSLSTLSMNMKYARTKSAEDIGLRPELSPPEGAMMELIKLHLTKMQKSFSPLKKLENLLCATSCIYKCVSEGGQKKTGQFSMGADDFLPMLIYVLVHCGVVSVEIEADYMWGLIQPSVLSGEGGYYLTSLSSAVLVLKNFRSMQEQQCMQPHGRLPSISDMHGFLKIAIPDELRDSIIWKTLPVRPNMTTKDVCSMIAHKFKITNPQDYGLYLLVKGEESRLRDMDCPQLIKVDHLTQERNCVFAFKRNAANIAWPMSLKKV